MNKEYIKEIIAIDPSINRCGWCIMSSDYTILKFGLIKSNKKDKWFDRAKIIANIVEDRVRSKHDLLVLEIPEHWNSRVGLAARESGSLFKLSFMCGIIFGKFNNIVMITPSGWKGQLSKEIVHKRLISKFKNRILAAEDHNVLDAIGIAYSYLNNWKVL